MFFSVAVIIQAAVPQPNFDFCFEWKSQSISLLDAFCFKMRESKLTLFFKSPKPHRHLPSPRTTVVTQRNKKYLRFQLHQPAQIFLSGINWVCMLCITKEIPDPTQKQSQIEQEITSSHKGIRNTHVSSYTNPLRSSCPASINWVCMLCITKAIPDPTQKQSQI